MTRILLILLFIFMAPAVRAEQSVLGLWMTADNGGVVKLEPCGAMICGIVDGITGFRSNGAPPVDNKGRSRCHLQIISDLVLEEPGLWAGHITNPDDGNVYSIHISLDPEGKLRMRGYIGIPLLGRTTVWTRYEGKLTPDCHLVRH
jgi:uncharacterized protein (DUF2147 family)